MVLLVTQPARPYPVRAFLPPGDTGRVHPGRRDHYHSRTAADRPAMDATALVRLARAIDVGLLVGGCVVCGGGTDGITIVPTLVTA